MMTSEQLIFFKKVAELEHMTKAAEALYVSQTHLSRSIAATEKELGVPLFDRIGRGIKLNDAGRLFYQYATKMIADYSDALVQVRNISEKANYQIAFATNVPAYSAPLLTRLLSMHPNLKILQNTGPRRTLITMLRNRRADFVVTAPPVEESDLSCETIYSEVPVIIYPEGHWLEKRDSVSIHEIADERFIGVPVGYGARDCMEYHCDNLNVHIAYSMETADTASVSSYVQYGLGIAFIPKTIALQNEFTRTHYVDLEEDMPCLVSLIWRSDFIFGETEHLFVEAIRHYFRDEARALLELHRFPQQTAKP